jgi:hypothetical protein
MERETELELATSSLEIWAWIEDRKFSVYDVDLNR